MKTADPKKNRRGVLSAYMKPALKHPWMLTLALLSVIGTQAASLISPLFLRQFFNVLSAGKPSSQTLSELMLIVGGIAAVSVFNWLMQRAQAISSIMLDSHVMQELYDSTFEYLIGHSYNFFISHFAGSLTHRVNKFVRAFETLFDGILFQFFPTALFVFGAVIILGFHNLFLGIALGAWAVIFLAFLLWITKRRQPLREARAAADTNVTGTLSDAVANHSTVVLFSGHNQEGGLFSRAVAKWDAATLKIWWMDERMWAVVGLFFISINIGLLWGAALLWNRGMLTVGDFVLIQSYLLSTFNQLLGINRELRRFFDANADAAEMLAMLNTPHEIVDAPDAKPLLIKNGNITLQNVDFYFNDTRAVLQKFNLIIPGGEKVALVGPSGAGKSTLTKLLLRLYDTTAGDIEIDGQNIARATQDSVRDTIAFVPQEPVLFHRSLMDNIRYGRRGATDEEVIEAAKKAHCHEFISALPEKYGTFVGERGVKLSGGERQRVALARAILKNSPILLLDEATSSLDSESEALIQDALETLMEGKTVIVIAHRLSTIMKMDRIIVLEHGAIVADGTHDELLEQKGLYHKLWSIQAGGFLKDEDTEEEE